MYERQFLQILFVMSLIYVAIVSSCSMRGHALEFDHEMLERIEKEIIRYEDISLRGGWQRVDDIEDPLELGTTDHRVPQLVKRLVTTNDMVFDICESRSSCTFNHLVRDGVIRFQSRHGLSPDGVVGPNTLRALNEPVEVKLTKLYATSQQASTKVSDLSDRYVIINIPSFSISYFENAEEKFQSRAIVGKKSWPTPVMSDQMEYFILNPYWRVPASILAEEIAPKALKDPEYIQEKEFVILRDHYLGKDIVNPATVDWSAVARGASHYYVTQLPGENNPLGRVKYIFPNNESVYVHDTAARHLFDRPSRDLSHGCIRIERPFEFAHHVLGEHPRSGAMESIFDTLKTGDPTRVLLDRPLPVHIVYWTAWANKDGTTHFRDDIYGHYDNVISVKKQNLKREQPAWINTSAFDSTKTLHMSYLPNLRALQSFESSVESNPKNTPMATGEMQ